MVFFKKKPLTTLNSVEILSKNILHNLSVLKKASGGKVLFPLLKSNAYGHGIEEVSTVLKKYETPYIAVDSYAEALKIWKKKGEKISYNGTFTAKKEMEVGILPIGYQEFLDRRLSNCGSFLSGKISLPLLGRVCMNLCCFDAGKKKIKIGEKIKVLSEKKNEENSAENIAKKIGTIPYEILTGVDASMRRTIV